MKSSSDSRRLVAVCCGLMLLYGLFLGAIQAVIESVARDLSVGTTGQGLLVSAQFLPAAFVPVWMGAVSDRVGRKPVLAAFCAVFGAGLVVCGLSGSVAVYVLGAIAVGAGYSVCESGCCAAMSDLGPDAARRGINLSQALLCLGAMVSPAVIRWAGLSWRGTLLACAAGYAVALPFVLWVKFPTPVPADKEDRSGLRALARSWAFLCLFIAMFLYVGLETGFGFFIESLMSSRFAPTAISCVSAYWLGMALSRFLFSCVSYRSKPVLVACLTASAALYIALVRSSIAGLSLALCGLTGFAYGPVWSTLMAEAAARFPSHAGSASGLMSAACGVGGILFPALTGVVAGRFSLPTAFVLMSAVALAGALCCAALPKTGAPDAVSDERM